MIVRVVRYVRVVRTIVAGGADRSSPRLRGSALQLKLRAVLRVAGVAVLIGSVAGCGSPEGAASSAGSRSAASDTPALLDVVLPDLARLDESVRAQVRDQHAALMMLVKSAPAGAELGAAFGKMGMLLHAAEYLDVAEPAYLNAQALMPGDPRWPYYLGHLQRTEGETAKSIAAFQRALDLRPADLATLVWLGRSYLEQGEPDRAEALFTKARALERPSVAVLAGLGQLALARKDYAGAVKLLEEALSIDPDAASLHSPLAMAFRGLGNAETAETHIKQWRNTETPLADPLRAELDSVLESGLSYELRGVQALSDGNWTAAAELFRKGVALSPGHTSVGRSLRHKLGTALALGGDVAGAMAQFEETVRLAPANAPDEPAAKASYSLGVLAASAGGDGDAIERFTAAVRYNPNYLEARMGLADALRRAGRFAASLPHYGEAVRINPRTAEARFGYAMALVRLRRDREARDWLAEAARVHPGRPEFKHALARVLAAAPSEGVRDGRQAMAIVQELLERQKSTDVGETMAMAAAELGDFTGAAAIQRDVMDAARRAGLEQDVKRMAANLRLYERGQPCRTPWPADDPVHVPGAMTSGRP
jgi:tetratricopeptide (TPR) repeat protein